MRSYKDILSVSLLLFAIGWSLWFVFAGFGNPQDPLYWLYKYQTLECGWMAVGTILTGAALVRLFGANLLMLRLAAWATVAAAIVLPYCALLTKEQRRDNIHWLALAFAFMNYGAFQEFSSGTLTVLFLSAIWVCATKFEITNHHGSADRQKSQIVTAILAGIAVTVRFPNILVLLILIPLWRKKSLWLVPIAALSAGLVYLFGYALITSVSMDPSMGSHGVGEMISALWERSYVLLLYLIMGGGALAIGYYINHKSQITNYKLPIAIGILVGALLSCYVTFAIPTWKWYNIDLTYMISAMVLVLTVGKLPITHTAQADRKNYQLPIGALLLSIATLGTDMAWLKLFPAVLCLLPVAASSYEAPMRRYLFPLLAIFAVTVMIRFSINSVGSSNLRVSNTPSQVAPYTHIRITDKEEAWMQQVRADRDSLAGEVLAVGRSMHLMRAITGCEAAVYNEFWSNIYDSVYTRKYEAFIEARQPIVFCSFAPGFKKENDRDTESCLENMLRAHGYRTLDRSAYKYMIYLPPNHQSSIIND